MIRRVLAGTTAATPFVLRRSRLEERLDDAFGKRLTLVIAGAGYGKSTLVAGWTEDVVTAWHTATPGDRRLSSLAVGIAEAVRPYVPGATELLGPLTAADDELVQAETLAALLSDALEPGLDHDLVLILDDAQELASSPASLRLVESLCRQGPPGLRLVLLSREALDLRVDRLRAQGQVLELDASDLAFTPEEVEALSRTLLHESRRDRRRRPRRDGRLAGGGSPCTRGAGRDPARREKERPRPSPPRGRSALLVPRERGLRARIARRSRSSYERSPPSRASPSSSVKRSAWKSRR